MPGVTAVTVAQAAVLTDSTWSRSIEVFGYTPKEGERLAPWTNQVGPGYFRTLGLALVAGREFTQRDEDGAPRVAVVNEAFARYVFGDASPLGRQFRFKGDPKEWPPLEIVGVMKDSLYATMRESEAGATPTFVYTPYAQSKPLAAMTAYVRPTPEAHAGIADRLRAVVRSLDAGIPVLDLQSMETTVDQALFTERMLALLSAAFGLVATVLAAIGLYGVMAYTVARRTREIGIHMALGAERSTVVRMVLGEVVGLTLVGIACGFPAVMALSRVARAQLFGISPTDPMTPGFTALLLAAVGTAAGLLPARRATRMNLMLTLRYE